MTNRQIKFRAFNIVTKIMIDLHKITPLALNIDIDGLFIPFSDEMILMQFTGLLDLNSKEIYEGDIVKVIDHSIDKLNGNNIVGWSIPGAYWKLEGKLPFLLHKGGYMQVIGNIYENPELLND